MAIVCIFTSEKNVHVQRMKNLYTTRIFEKKESHELYHKIRKSSGHYYQADLLKILRASFMQRTNCELPFWIRVCIG